MTTPASTGRAWVQPPPLEPYMYGLLSVATVVNGNGPWQINGVEYYTDACAQGGTVDGLCPKPRPGQPLTGTITATQVATEFPIEIRPVSPTSTEDVLLYVDALAPGPVTFTVTPPAPGTPSEYVVSPGGGVRVDTSAYPGAWSVQATGVPGAAAGTLGCPDPLTFTSPYTAGTAPLASCTGTRHEVTLAAPATNGMTVAYRIDNNVGPLIGGALVPGRTTTLVLDPSTYVLFAYPYSTGGDLSQNAVLQVPLGTAVTVTVTIPAGVGTTHEKLIYQGLDLVEGGNPFTVYARAECNAVGFEDAAQRAMARLGCIENREVEKWFSSRMLGADGARLPAGTEAVSLLRAIGLLEQDAALNYCGRPVLHAPRWVAPYFADRFELQDVQGARNILRTILEAKISFGGGYYDNPFAPGTALPGPGYRFWLVATGTVRAYRTESFVNEAFDHGHPSASAPGTYTSTNQRVAIAERTYAFDHDCYRAAVLVALDPETVTAPAPVGGLA